VRKEGGRGEEGGGRGSEGRRKQERGRKRKCLLHFGLDQKNTDLFGRSLALGLVRREGRRERK
jgi:hypothetical protein